MVALGKVLILAREEVVAALLGLMAEFRGLQPTFLRSAEHIEGAISREKPDTVLIDYDHPDCGDALLKAIRQTGAVPILFSPFRMQSEARSLAARHGIRSFTLPTDADTLGRVLDN